MHVLVVIYGHVLTIHNKKTIVYCWRAMLFCTLIFGIYVLLYINFCGLLLLSFISYIQILHASHHPPFPSKIRVHPWIVGSSHHTTRGVPYHSECLCRLRNRCLLRSVWLSYFVPEHILHNWQMTSIRLWCRDRRWNGWVCLLEISIDENNEFIQ